MTHPTILATAKWCVCGHLEQEHLFLDKGKRAGQRGECQTRSADMRPCCPNYQEKP